jgi:hypothetical protein
MVEILPTTRDLVRPPVAALVVAFVVAGLGAGCNLPGLTAELQDTGSELGGPDGGRSDTGACPVPQQERVCRPGWRECARGGAGVRRCSDCGRSFEFEMCPEGEFCEGGRCQPLANECDTSLPFRLSASSLTFDSNGRLRPDSGALALENCSSFDIVLQRANIQHENHPTAADREVFSLTNRYPLEGVTVPAGEELPIRMEYRPTFGFYPQTNVELEVDVRADQPYVTGIPLQRRIHCVTAPPTIDVGTWKGGAGTSVEVPVANCGTETTLVSRPSVEELEAEGADLEASGDRRRRLAPGDVERFAFDLRAESPGRADVELGFESRRAAGSTSRRAEEATTRVSGRARAGNCSEPEEISPPTYRTPDEADWQSGHRATLAPGEPIDLRLDDDRPGAAPIWMATRPNRSRSNLRAHPSGDREHLRFVPDVPGTYTFAYEGTDDNGRPTCKTNVFRLEVTPEAPLYVELAWTTRGDPIADDRGYGRGVDLNLHVKPGTEEEPGRWGEPTDDCFQPGDRATRGCERGDGEMRWVSAASGSEAVAFQSPEDLEFDIAARVWNTYRFSGAEATVRVYDDGRLVERFPAEGDGPRRVGGSAGTVWMVGTYSPEEGQMEIADAVRKDFER